MVITEFLERNARLYGSDTALVELNPSHERDSAVTWREASLIESAGNGAPYRRELSWTDFDRRANRFANLLLSRGLERETKVGILMMNCLEWLPIYFGILKAGGVAVPLNFRYSAEEIKYCLELADVEVLVFGPEFISRMDTIADDLPGVRMMFFPGPEGPSYTEDCLKLMRFCSSSAPPVALEETDYAAIYFSSGTTGFPKAILHNHRALRDGAETSRADQRGCVPLHSAPLSYRREDALVRFSDHGRQGSAPSGCETGVDPAGGHGGKMHHRMAVGSLGAGPAGCDRFRECGYGTLSVRTVAFDAHRRTARSAEPDPALEEAFSASSV